ncbi:hypothetical protein [Dyadobacter psychrotolerans]|uniref:Uncharacterized protein n=1 Tax=Dyadobacter psychrotolerans TaxID=2541721 RepID=A0A4R5DEY1_9BACT|nr:hypothetical protein [Dyadobacter psychrotolerans]TDE12472.1 hypothetical protein E0F88_22530 [Dyadobacter psychrotolerans]
MKATLTVVSRTRILTRVIIGMYLLCMALGCETPGAKEKEPDKNSIFKVGKTELNGFNMLSSNQIQESYNPKQPKFSQVRVELTKEMGKVLVNKLESYFHQSIRYKDQQPKYITLFTTKSTTDIEMSDIKGIGTLSTHESGMFHLFYTVNGSTLQKDDRFSLYTDYLRVADMDLLGAVVFNNPSLKWTMVNIPDSKMAVSSEFKSKSYRDKENSLGLAIANSSEIPFDMVASDCTSCNDPYSGFCEPTSSGYPQCNPWNPDPITCGESKINAEMGARVSNSEKSLNTAEAYNFRDNFMSKTKIGKSYTDFYYTISKVAIRNNGINAKNVVLHFDFATKIHGIAKKLQFGSDNDIVYQDDFRNEAQSFINTYRKLSNDSTFLNALAIIENDLNRFKGKSRREILISIGL